MNEHIVSSYDDELNKLQTLIMTMGTTATEMVDNAVDALLNADKESARTIIDTDRAINAGLSRLTELSQNILALRSPMANDLRKVLSAIQVGLNIERVGDLAKNMAKLPISNEIFIEDIYAVELRKMGKIASGNLFDSLKTYNQENAEEALIVHANDIRLDELHKAFSKSVMLNITKDVENIDSSIHLLFVSRHLERVGDHAKNIAEATIYKVKGEIYEPND
ncbi:MAG: phosphate signaling complex protein PhoU [Candidatus Puniceispirillaceae bacterium]|jgi:phosphate transport system protein